MDGEREAEGPAHVAVIGAGIVGVATAIRLLRDGRRVTLIDAKGPAEGTSFGNAGLLAAASFVPVTVPGLVAKAPRMLFDPDQPLFLRWGYLPRLAPWLLRYLRHATPEHTHRIAAGLYGIVGDTVEEHLALAEGTGAERWIVPSDYFYLYPDRAAFERDVFGWEVRRTHGVTWQELEGEALRSRVPAVSGLDFGVCVGGHGRISDPGAYVRALAAHAEAEGARLLIATVEDVVREAGRVTGVRAGGETIPCDAVVIAAGAWSRGLVRRLGLDIPLESERGYHLEFWEPSVTLSEPVAITTGKFLLTPMEGRLRAAGVVEFGGLEAGPSEAPFRLLERQARAALPGLSEAKVTRWMGHRPATTDSLPAVGEVPGVAGAWLAFGHQHIGLTAGPKTGRLLAQMIAGRRPNLDMTPYAPSRFA
ncbi:MAG: FAD-dependent oxidoreductase [Pseudomonadota bacterium]